MQPLRPQGHLAPPRLTTMWPISPAAPRPSQGLPSRTRPPPTPVPQKTPIRLWNSRPAPRWNSASVATWTSLPTRTSVPSASRAFRRAGSCPPSRAGCGRRRRRRSSRRRRRASRRRLPSAPPARRRPPAAASRSAVRHRLGDVLRARRWSASAAAPRRSTSPPASTIAVWIFVPPRSMPPRSSATRAVYARVALES